MGAQSPHRRRRRRCGLGREMKIAVSAKSVKRLLPKRPYYHDISPKVSVVLHDVSVYYLATPIRVIVAVAVTREK